MQGVKDFSFALPLFALPCSIEMTFYFIEKICTHSRSIARSSILFNFYKHSSISNVVFLTGGYISRRGGTMENKKQKTREDVPAAADRSERIRRKAANELANESSVAAELKNRGHGSEKSAR
jgi:hypothetical protein